jgi:hypothetical protein
MIITKVGILLMLVGCLISILFWIPQVVNRKRLKEIIGPRYPLIYFFYITNGPVLFLVGYYLFQYNG